MKKYVFLGIIICFALPFTSGCSFFNPSSNIEVSAPNAGTTESDNAASEGETTPSSDVEDSSYADSSVNADETAQSMTSLRTPNHRNPQIRTLLNRTMQHRKAKLRLHLTWKIPHTLIPP